MKKSRLLNFFEKAGFTLREVSGLWIHDFYKRFPANTGIKLEYYIFSEIPIKFY